CRVPLGHHPGRLLQAHGQARVQDGAAAPSLRAARLGGVARDHPVLDPGVALCGAGTLDAQAAMSALPRTMPRLTAAAEPLPRRIAVLGFARSGRALAEALVERGVSVTVADARPESELSGVEALRRRGVRFFLGDSGSEFLEDAEWLAVSPGVPLTAPLVAAAREAGIPVLAEIEIAFRIAEAESPEGNRWVAITGTNGKSTTTAWIAEILKRAGRPVALAGNIGSPLSGFLQTQEPRDFVCELSSFQLEAIDRFRPHVAVLTNITPDHLDRYADFSEYAAAKARIFENQDAGDFAVVNADDPA